ncbi:MAG: septum formation inhibitor Maf, partial [Mesorhizobium sp.]
MAEKIILASGSPFRKALLVHAGVPVEAVPAEVDERALEAPLKGSG